MATKKWFVEVGAEEMGPLGPGGLRKLVQKGQIKADTLVRREDQDEPVPAIQVRGLLTGLIDQSRAPRAHGPRAVIHGPFTELKTMGWSTAVALFLFALLGVYGVVVAVGQLQNPDPTLLVPLFGAGVWAVLALVAVGGLFLWWLFTARINLPHLIHAHIRLSPSWAVASWFVPFVNLARPYVLIAETDKLSAEAFADGDARVEANHGLLAPWWTAAILGTAFALTYMLMGVASADDVRLVAWLHIGAGLSTLVAGVLAGWLVLRITLNQERAHERHPEPVEPHRPHKHGHHERIPILQGAE